MHKDVSRFYPICYLALVKLCGQLNELSLENVKAIKEMIKSYMKITEELQSSIGGMLSQLKEKHVAIIDFSKVLPYNIM